MEELARDHPGRDYVCQWQSGRWTPCVPEERAGRIEGPERMCHLLLGYLYGYADPEQEVRNVQERVPLCMSVPVVQE